MKTRTSLHNQNIIFRELFQPSTKSPVRQRPLYLNMTDEQIDEAYYYLGKADRVSMKRAAAQERQRRLVQATLDKERV